MDFDNPRQRDVFFDVHTNLPREGPGNRDCTMRALSLAGQLPEAPSVLDVACGPGLQTVHLAELLPDATITAVDLNQAMTDQARRKIESVQMSDRIRVETGDMAALTYPDAAFDLIWCEGAAYNIGVERAIRNWKRMLKPAGKVALTDAVWLRRNPPADLAKFWQVYPDMSDAESRRQMVRDCGYLLRGDFILPEAAWWDDYYQPMKLRLQMLAAGYENDSDAMSVIDECNAEIAFYERYAEYYGYMFLVMSIP
jgi:SAM-dependent methyltransferase